MPTLELPQDAKLAIVRDFLKERLAALSGRARTLEATTHMHALALELHFVETTMGALRDGQD